MSESNALHWKLKIYKWLGHIEKMKCFTFYCTEKLYDHGTELILSIETKVQKY